MNVTHPAAIMPENHEFDPEDAGQDTVSRLMRAVTGQANRQMLIALSRAPLTAIDLADQVGCSLEETVKLIQHLLRLGLAREHDDGTVSLTRLVEVCEKTAMVRIRLSDEAGDCVEVSFEPGA